MNSAASYDLLETVSRLEGATSGVTISEVQNVCYLSCLLSVYSGNPASEWGYHFVHTDFGAPYSQDIDEAFRNLHAAGDLVERDEASWSTQSGSLLLEQIRAHRINASRVKYLEAACSTAIALSGGIVRSALKQEPSIRSVRRRLRGGFLLDQNQPSYEVLHEHFSALSRVIGGEVSDLLVPSSAWLAYLGELQKEEEEEFYSAGN